MAKAYPSGTPLGIRQLSEQSRIMVRQKGRSSVQNKYKVMTPGGRELLYAKENSGTLNALFGGKDRSFHIDIVDTENNVVINLRRPRTFGPDKMDVTVCNQLASVVRQKSTFFKPVLLINDACDRPVLKIKGPIGQSGTCDFDVFTLDKTKIGVIQKQWGGMMRELLTDRDSYCIDFPEDLDVRFKAALLGACFLIDFLYYEN